MFPDIVPFTIGLSIGASVLAVLRILPEWKAYVLNCGKLSHQCPHHGPGNNTRMQDINDKTRNGPPRPDIH